MSIPATARDVLGNERPVKRTYENGAWDCPFCAYPISPDRGETACTNPWCIANPIMPVEAARKLVTEREQRQRDAEARQRNHELAMARIARDRDERAQRHQEAMAEARSRGACVRCCSISLVRGGDPKFVRHRGVCPAERS